MNQPSENESANSSANSSAYPTAGPKTDQPPAAEAKPLSGWRAIYDFLMQSYCWLVIFVVLYVLSVGPFYNEWRQAVDMGRRPLLQVFYLPLATMCNRSETVNTVVEWYVGFWQS